LDELRKSRTLKKLRAVAGVRFTLLGDVGRSNIYVEFQERLPDSR
jgi:hypothetical protein